MQRYSSKVVGASNPSFLDRDLCLADEACAVIAEKDAVIAELVSDLEDWQKIADTLGLGRDNKTQALINKHKVK